MKWRLPRRRTGLLPGQTKKAAGISGWCLHYDKERWAVRIVCVEDIKCKAPQTRVSMACSRHWEQTSGVCRREGQVVGNKGREAMDTPSGFWGWSMESFTTQPGREGVSIWNNLYIIPSNSTIPYQWKGRSTIHRVLFDSSFLLDFPSHLYFSGYDIEVHWG